MKTIIWTKDNCIFCTKAKELLVSTGVVFEERHVAPGSKWTREMLLEEIPTAKTYPQIYLYGKYVGGYTELAKYYEDHGMESNEGF